MSEQIFLLGASGHAKMVIESIRCQSKLEVVACLAPTANKGEKVLGVPVLSEDEELLRDFERRRVLGFVAIGDNNLRCKLLKKLVSLGIEVPAIIAATAYVSHSAKIGIGTVVMPKAAIGADTIVGIGAIINTASSIDHDGIVGDFVHIGPGCHLAGNVQVCDRSFLGVGTIVIPEVKIGANATLGAGAVVTKNVPDNEIWIGCPARPMRR